MTIHSFQKYKNKLQKIEIELKLSAGGEGRTVQHIFSWRAYPKLHFPVIALVWGWKNQEQDDEMEIKEMVAIMFILGMVGSINLLIV